MKQVKLAVFNLVCAAMTGCIPAMGELSDPCGGAACQSIVEVQFDVGSRSPLKSAISPEEDAVSNLNIYVYSGGNLVAAEYYEEDFNPSMKLLFGETYNMYALANVGLFEAPIDEGVFREYCQCRISRIHDMRELIPMAWIAEDFTIGSPSQRVRVDLERLVAKLVFSVDKSALKGLEINYARLCQSPRVVWPFRYPEGSRVETYDDVFDCDYASRNDLEALNAGEQVSFYMLENCQGRILDGNTDPWAKVPENIPGKESLCTYLEVGGMFKTGFFYQGSVTYRLYLGQDSVSDFDIRRNTLMNASLYLTDDAFDKISWRIDSSVSISDGYVGGWISNGRHAVDDLYVGERFVYTVVLADEMINHLDGNYKDAHLCVLDSSGNKSEFIEFSGLNEVESEAGVNMYEVQGLCLQPGSGVIVLVDGNGELLVELESCNIQKPLLRATETIPIEDDDKIAADVAQLVLPINSEGVTFYLYFLDKEGYNLNASRGCGFEISLFDLDVDTGVLDEYLSSTLDFQVVSGEGFDDGRAATFHARCVNDGKDKKVNESLIKYVTKVGECEFDICETNYDLKSLHAFSLDYLPITLSLVDNGWAGYDDCQLSIVVDNPSLLPINVTCWQLNQAGGSYNAVTRNEIVDLYGQEFTRRRYNYVCKDFSPGEMPFYCSGTSFVAGENGAYPMPELSTTMIYYALLYDYLGQAVLIHQLDAVFDGGEKVYNLNVENNLADASLEYRYLYGSDGWNDKGIWLYTSDYQLSKPSIFLDEMNGLSPVGLSTLSGLEESYITIGYNANTQNLCASVNSTFLSGVKLNTEIVITASGYVQTTPNGSWGKKVDNYCTAKVSKVVEDVALTTTFTPIDGNAIIEAMNSVYLQTFFDSYNLIGSSSSYNHSAHPTSLDVKLRFSLGDGDGYTMIPIVATFPASVTFYHAQENVSYSVPVNTTNTVNSLAIVENLSI